MMWTRIVRSSFQNVSWKESSAHKRYNYNTGHCALFTIIMVILITSRDGIFHSCIHPSIARLIGLGRQACRQGCFYFAAVNEVRLGYCVASSCLNQFFCNRIHFPRFAQTDRHCSSLTSHQNGFLHT